MDRQDMDVIDYNHTKKAVINKLLSQLHQVETCINHKDERQRTALVQAVQFLQECLRVQRTEINEDLEEVWDCNAETRSYHAHSKRCAQRFVMENIK